MKVVAFAGGVGGAKLAHGLAQVLPPEDLTIVVNTGDDFDHLGLRICPDLDTVLYTLAGLANPVTGWGREDETWNVMENLARLNGVTWFRVGDKDLATHLERTRRLARGERLSTVTQAFCAAWGVRPTVLPVTDDRCATWVETEEMGWLPFQEYFVLHQCAPRVKSFRFEGAEAAAPAPGITAALEQADVVVICPSNPWVSIGPILAVAPIVQLLENKCVVAVSPIVGGKAIKGPAAKMFQELGIEPTALAVARHYREMDPFNRGKAPEYRGNGFVMDNIDQDQAADVQALGVEVLVTDTIMKNSEDRRRLAEEVLTFSSRLYRRTERL